MYLEIIRYGVKGGIPLQETSMWKASDATDKRAVRIATHPDNLWLLVSINDVLVDITSFSKIVGRDGTPVIADNSPYWEALNLPLKDGVELIDKRTYDSLVKDVFPYR